MVLNKRVEGLDIKKEIKNLKEELIDLRRDFHMHPELGFEEYRTSQIVEDYLKECGLEVQRVAKTGIVALLKGEKPGKTVLLRSDLDALPIKEENDLLYKSTYKGKMHACGHDGHIAMLLIAAKILSLNKNKLKGNVKFVFQPNEEDAGAEIMIREGILDNPKVDAAFGIHLWTPIKTGSIGIASGPIMASSYYFKLVIHGEGGHGGAPHTAVDPIVCAANIIQMVQTIQTREVDALKPTVITFGKINCGTSPIIIPDKIELEGSIRCLYEGEEEIHQKFERIIKSICDAHQTTYSLEIKCGNILLSNDEEMTSVVESAAKDTLGTIDKINRSIKMMVGEDFAEFATRVPSAFSFVGAGNRNKGTDYPHHHPRFNIDEDSLPIGVEIHVRTVLEFLNR